MDTTSSYGGNERIAGLDGLRGLAVAMVLGFHLYPRLVPGGWLGVSLFFTLSGYLITTVILRDRDAGTFTFGSFYARRVRRLLPAAVLVLTVFAAVWSLLGWFNEDHRTDVFFSLLQVANWQQIWEGVPYGTALASPVVHYWSLAIEEQAYVVLPLLLVVFGARWMRLVAPALFVASVAATFIADGNRSVIYFGTHTRAAEIMAGVMVALLFHARASRPNRTVSTVLSLAGIAYLTVAAVVVHLNDEIVYSGGLIVTGLVSAMVIATLPTSALAPVFNLGVLTWLGTVSYGVYLVHWPVLMTLKETSLPQWAIAPSTLVITIGAAHVMYRHFELPMRFSVAPRRIVASGVAAAMLLGAAFTTTKEAPPTFEALQQSIDQDTDGSGELEIFLLGDSRALTFRLGVRNHRRSRPDGTHLFDIGRTFVRLGCPIGRGGRVRTSLGTFETSRDCDWTRSTNTTADIAVIWAGEQDTLPRDTGASAGREFQTIRDSDYRQWLAAEYSVLVDKLLSNPTVKLVAVVNHNTIKGETFPDEYNQFLRTFSRRAPVVHLDLNSYLSRAGVDSYVPDGKHLTFGKPVGYSLSGDNSAADLYERWFEPVLCAAVKERQPELIGDIECPTVDHTPRVPTD